MQILAVEVAPDVEPTAVVESDRVDHHGVPFPVTDRFTFPCSVQLIQRCMLPAVDRNDAVLITPTLSRRAHIEEEQLRRCLYNLRRRAHARNSRRHASER